MGSTDSIELRPEYDGQMAAFRCVRSLVPGPNPGKAIVLKSQRDPWVRQPGN